MRTDYLVIGAGFYGLFSAVFLARGGAHVTLLDREPRVFSRASYVNQARVHNGYHYPRSLATARKTRKYFERFNEEFGYAVNDAFDKIYAIAQEFSYTDPAQFERFCGVAGIPLETVPRDLYFKPEQVAAAYKVREYTYDANALARGLIEEIKSTSANLLLGRSIVEVEERDGLYRVSLDDSTTIMAPRVLNATYASVNQVNRLFSVEPEMIKYELCEVTMVNTDRKLRRLGITVLDGPFFSLMPFGDTGLHSLTSVTFTPHQTSHQALPEFTCQSENPDCSSEQLDNCRTCPAAPESAWPYMRQLARKFLTEDLEFGYKGSLFAVKPILEHTEMDDGRPTLIRKHRSRPTFRTVLSGKINTVFDLEGELEHDLAS